MPPTDLSQYVTRAELAGQLAPLAEIRTMLRDDMRGLHEGQDSLRDQIAEMDQRLVGRMDTANHRTLKLETRLEAADKLLAEGQAHIAGVEQTVTDIKEHGCHQLQNHTSAVGVLQQAGVEVGAAPEIVPSDRPSRLRQHGPKVAAGGGLVGIGLILPHVWTWLHWLMESLEKAMGLLR